MFLGFQERLGRSFRGVYLHPGCSALTPCNKWASAAALSLGPSQIFSLVTSSITFIVASPEVCYLYIVLEWSQAAPPVSKAVGNSSPKPTWKNTMNLYPSVFERR